MRFKDEFHSQVILSPKVKRFCKREGIKNDDLITSFLSRYVYPTPGISSQKYSENQGGKSVFIYYKSIGSVARRAIFSQYIFSIQAQHKQGKKFYLLEAAA